MQVALKDMFSAYQIECQMAMSAKEALFLVTRRLYSGQKMFGLILIASSQVSSNKSIEVISRIQKAMLIQQKDMKDAIKPYFVCMNDSWQN